MPEPKTKPTGASVSAYIAAIGDAERRKDCRTVAALMKRVTGEPARMWGPGIVGFGTWHGPTGDWPVAAFASRKDALTLYLMPGFQKMPAMKRLGRVKTGKSCLYVKRLADVDLDAVEELVSTSMRLVRKKYPG